MATGEDPKLDGVFETVSGNETDIRGRTASDAASLKPGFGAGSPVRADTREPAERLAGVPDDGNPGPRVAQVRGVRA